MKRNKLICAISVMLMLFLSSCGDAGGGTVERDEDPPVWGSFLGPQFTNISDNPGPNVEKGRFNGKVLDYSIRSNIVVDNNGFKYVIVEPNSSQLIIYKLDSNLDIKRHSYIDVEIVGNSAPINFTIDRNNTLYIPHGDNVYIMSEAGFIDNTVDKTLPLKLHDGVAPVLVSSGHVIFSHEAVDEMTLSIYPILDTTQESYDAIYQSNTIESSTVTPVIYQDHLFVHGVGRVRVFNIQNMDIPITSDDLTTPVEGDNVAKRMIVNARSGDVFVEYVDASGDAVVLKSFDARTSRFNWNFSYDIEDPNVDLKSLMGVDSNGLVSFLDRPLGLVKMALYSVGSSGLDRLETIGLCGFTEDLSAGNERCESASLDDPRVLYGFDSKGVIYLAFADTDNLKLDYKSIDFGTQNNVVGKDNLKKDLLFEDRSKVDSTDIDPNASALEVRVGGQNIITGLPNNYQEKLNVSGDSFLMLEEGLLFTIDKTLYLYK